MSMHIDLLNYYEDIDRREIMRVEDSKSFRAIAFFDAAIDGNDIWFSSNEFNGLFHGYDDRTSERHKMA